MNQSMYIDIGSLYILECSNRIMLLNMLVYSFNMSSIDVIHSFTIPCLGLKCDVIPGRINQVNCLFNIKGIYYGQCSELCGSLHGYMPINITVG
jgi:heme/copper-type cytochrome/quinol oxidase subunit 2